MLITNERIKSYLTDPTLYRTVVTIGDHVNETRQFTCYSWSEGDDIQTAENISVQFISSHFGVDEESFTEVTTDTYSEIWR